MLRKVQLQLPLSEITKQRSKALISQILLNSNVCWALFVRLVLTQLSFTNRRVSQKKCLVPQFLNSG